MARLAIAASCSLVLLAPLGAAAKAPSPTGCAVAGGPAKLAKGSSLIEAYKHKGAACAALPPTDLGLLVLFDAALLDTHDEASVRGWIDERVAEANDVWALSGAPALAYQTLGVRPVSVPLPDYTPGNGRVRIEDILLDWAGDADAHFTALRDAYGADMVIFITTPFLDDYFGGDICGVATVPRLVDGQETFGGAPFDKRAFAVMEYQCGEGFDGKTPVNDYTFAHELGHTMGMQHSEEDASFPVSPGTGVGHILDLPSGAQAASLMHCVYDDSRPVPAGVCTRIPHLSNPEVGYVEGGACKGCLPTPTGSAAHNNAALACARAPMYSDFGTPDGDDPPTVQAWSSPASGTVLSGSVIQVWATASDAIDGNLSGQIEWVDSAGEVLATGASASLFVQQTGQIAARVTDSAGQRDLWWLPLQIVASPDAFEPDDSGPAPTIALGTTQARNFHTEDDVDRVRVNFASTPTTVVVDAVATGDRAEPVAWVRSCLINGCGGPTPVALPYERVVSNNSFFIVEIRDANGKSGAGTEYELSVEEAIEPPALSPLTGPFFNPARNGHGIDFQQGTPGHYVAIWYTYRANGLPTWYITDVAPLQGHVWTAELFSSTWDYTTNTNSIQSVGSLTMTFSDEEHAFFQYEVNGITGGEPFETLAFGAPFNGPANGMWYPPAESGWGVSVWHRGNVLVVTNYTYDANGLPVFTQASNTGSPDGISFELYQTAGGTSVCPGCTGNTPIVIHPEVGTAYLDVNTGSGQGTYSMSVDYVGLPGVWNRGGTFVRLTN